MATIADAADRDSVDCVREPFTKFCLIAFLHFATRDGEGRGRAHDIQE